MRAIRALALSAVVFAIIPIVTLGAQTAPPFKDCAACPEMVVVPPGEIGIGSDDAEIDREQPPADVGAMERPRHTVRIAKPFAVSRFEITRAQYALFADSTERPDGARCFVWDEANAKWENRPGVTWRDPGFAQAGDEPVVCVSWDDAAAFAAWLAARTGQPYRLLSESEWEYAARAGTASARPWTGPDRAAACRHANVSDQARAAAEPNAAKAAQAIFPCDDGGVYTASVGRFAPNAFGLHDMLGNVWEWTIDCHHESYDGAPADGSPWIAGDCRERSNRGGSWADPMWRVRSAVREWDPAGGRYAINGMRVARDLP